MHSATVPPMYPKRTNLGDINYELTGNGYSSAINSDDPSALMDVSVNADFKSEYILFKNALIDKYWWQEIGCDVEEIFIEKFKSRWDIYAPLYANNIRILTNNFIYDRIKSSNKSNTRGTGYIMGQHTDSKSSETGDGTRGSDTSSSGTQKDFGANVQERADKTGTDSTYHDEAERGNETQQDTRRDNFGTDTEAVTETTTYYDIEKIREIPQALVLLEDFIHKFKSLFMTVYTEM